MNNFTRNALKMINNLQKFSLNHHFGTIQMPVRLIFFVILIWIVNEINVNKQII